MIEHFKSPKHAFLSNFALVKIEYGDMIYSSVEHAYMSAKSDDIQWKQYCANSNVKPGDVKKASRHIRLVDNWNSIKFAVMEECVRKKFIQEPFKTDLLATGNEHIQEGNWWNDKVWGVDLKSNPPVGENHLGKLIMKVREELKQKLFSLNEVEICEIIKTHFHSRGIEIKCITFEVIEDKLKVICSESLMCDINK